VKAELINSAWESKTISKTISIPKILKLSKEIDIYYDWEIIKNANYNKNLNEYLLDYIWVPWEIKLDARYVKADSTLYTLSKVEWDYDSDWNTDFTWQTWNYSINKEWNHDITVKIIFINRKIPDDKVEITEKIFINAIKKEAIIDFDIIKNSEYAPIILWFDASRAQVKDNNITKFSQEHDLNQAQVHGCIRKKKYRNSCKGWTFKVLEEGTVDNDWYISL
jgi:hypothetical protein